MLLFRIMQWNNDLLRSSILSYESSIGCLDIIEHKVVCMFDKFCLTFNFISKVSHDVFEIEIKCHFTCTFDSKMSPPLWITQYFQQTDNITNRKICLIHKQKKTINRA